MDKRQKILIVEDEAVLRKSLMLLFEGQGWTVASADSLDDALLAIDRREFDVALIDIMLNGQDDRADRGGVQVLSKLRKSGADTKVIILSGQDSQQFATYLVTDHGANDYFSKDQNENPPREMPGRLLKRVRMALRAKKADEKEKGWQYAAALLAPTQEESSFVHESMHRFKFSGGFPVFKDVVLDALKWLHPLLLPAGLGSAKPLIVRPNVFSTVLWSKEQGCAVEIILFGTTAKERAEILASIPRGTVLHSRTKAGLTAAVFSRPELPRSAFAS